MIEFARDRGDPVIVAFDQFLEPLNRAGRGFSRKTGHLAVESRVLAAHLLGLDEDPRSDRSGRCARASRRGLPVILPETIGRTPGNTFRLTGALNRSHPGSGDLLGASQ
jgi:hypothetical protein